MPRDLDETSDFLAQAYRVAKFIAISVASFVGVVVSVAALDIQISGRWTEKQFPNYLVALSILAVVALLGLPLLAASVLLRNTMRNSSFYRNKVLTLGAAVSGLEELAYKDPITGIPNSKALQMEINRSSESPRRCLILLDLNDFRSINKRYNHWKGDEYLREFALLIERSGRRNEYIYKRRTKAEPPPEGVDGKYENWNNDPRTFRKAESSDEFYLLLEGSVVPEGLGYLGRLARRSDEFEEMSVRVLGEVHPFAFCAGVTSVAPGENFSDVVKRVSECLRQAQRKDTPRYVYWPPEDERALSTKNREALAAAYQQFGKRRESVFGLGRGVNRLRRPRMARNRRPEADQPAKPAS
jgi:hypothetical protein